MPAETTSCGIPYNVSSKARFRAEPGHAGSNRSHASVDTDPMQTRWSALQASILLGLVWGAWHIIPYRQAHRSAEWIAWYCLFTVATRVLMVWLYNNTGKSVFGAALFHAMVNVSWFPFPNSSLQYDPRITGPIVALVAVIVTLVWGHRTLARYRYA